jgi:hypothetical protein
MGALGAADAAVDASRTVERAVASTKTRGLFMFEPSSSAGD